MKHEKTTMKIQLTSSQLIDTGFLIVKLPDSQETYSQVIYKYNLQSESKNKK